MALNVNVLMVSRVIPVSILTNAVTNVSQNLEDIQIHVMTVVITRLVRILKVLINVAVT